MKKQIVVVGALLAFAGACHGADSFVLASPEKAATVVLAKDCEPSSRLAAEELTNYVFRISGKLAKVRIEGAKGGLSAPRGEDASGTVRIGTMEKFPGEVPAEAKAALGKSKSDESAWTGVRGNTLWIVGVGKVAELYATYRFLEKHLGIRWLKAANEHDNGEYVPRRERIVLKPFAEYDEPALAVRRIDSCGGVVTKIARNGRNWALRNGLQTPPPIAYVGRNGPKGRPELWEFYGPRTIDRLLRVGGGHPTFYGPITPEKYFKDHPEYFALVDGRRVPGKQLCITHPEVLRILRDSILRNFEESGGIGNFHFGLHDVTSGWCECERCRKLDGGEPYACGIPNISTRFNKMVKLVADEVWKVRPDALLSEWAYSTYREIPEGVRPDPRMRVQYCPHGRCYGHDLDDPTCARNTYLYDLLKRWIAITPGGVYTYDYYFAPPPPLYTCAEHVLAHDLKLYKKLGMTGWKDEEYFEDTVFIDRFRKQYGPSVRDWYASNWQLLYVAGKMTWNPDLDVDKVLEDAESKYYGVAYPQMRKYHALRRRLWDAAPQCLGYPTGDQRRPNVLNQPGAKEELLGYLDEADKITKGLVDRSRSTKDDATSTVGLHLQPTPAVLQHRLSLDRRWLEDYWIKPNEEMREKRSRSLFAPRMKETVTVDGVGNEPDWAGACYVDSFAVPNDLWANFGPVPKELAVNVGILSDADSLYFLFNVKEPNVAGLQEKFRKHDDPAWHDDGVELFLYPATAANQYFQIVVSTAGVVYDVAHPGCDPAAELGVEAAVKKGADGFCVEVKVPAEKLLKLRDGDMWRCHFMRNRRVKDSLTPRAVSFAVDGVMPHDTVGYRTLTIGSAVLKNGGFEDVKDGRPAGWSLTGKTALVEEGTGRMLRIDHGGATQLMWGGPLRQSDKPRKIEYSFKAKSAGGGVRVSFVRYTDTPDEKAKHGYRRAYHNDPGKGGDYRPKGEGLEFFSGEYTIAPNEWVGIQFSNVNATPCDVDDVAVFLVE